MHPQSSPLPSVPGLMVDGRSPSPTTSYAMPSPPLAPLQFTTAAHSSKSNDGVRLPSINEALGDLLHPSSISSTNDRHHHHHHPHYLHSAMSMVEPRIPSVEIVRALTPSSPHLHESLSSSASSDVSNGSNCHHRSSSMTDTTMINTATTTTTSSITQSPLTHHHRHRHHKQVTLSMSSSKNGTVITPSSMIIYPDKCRHKCQLPTPSPPSPVVAESPLSPSSQSWMTANTTVVSLPINSSTSAEHTNYHHHHHHQPVHATTTSSTSSVTFVANSGVSHKKRPRRRPEEIERLYTCIYPGCTKAYGTLNHLNAHITMQRHGAKRLPSEFETVRKQYRAMKLQQRTMVQSATSMHL